MYSLWTSLLLAGSASAAALPTSGLFSRNETCKDASLQVDSWVVEDFDYHASYLFTNPAHQNSWGYVNFTLANPVLDYRPICSASSNQLSDFFYGTVNYECQLPEGVEVPEGNLATFNFSSPSKVLNINQTWECEDPMAAVVAQGGITLDLECTDETWENPDWQPGQFYSTRFITCEKVTVDVPVEEKAIGI